MSPVSIILATCLVVLLSPAILRPRRTLQKLRRKQYQYEVTFGLYMMTPTEKFIFNSILLITISLLIAGVVLYLPSHVSIIFQRAFYYYSGDFFSSTASPLASVTGGVTSITNAIQKTLSNANSEAFMSATHKVATSAQDLVKAVAAAAAGELVRASSQTTNVPESPLQEQRLRDTQPIEEAEHAQTHIVDQPIR